MTLLLFYIIESFLACVIQATPMGYQQFDHCRTTFAIRPFVILAFFPYYKSVACNQYIHCSYLVLNDVV